MAKASEGDERQKQEEQKKKKAATKAQQIKISNDHNEMIINDELGNSELRADSALRAYYKLITTIYNVRMT